jgi:hypothetical protein
LFVNTAIEGVKAVTQTGAQAISTVEKASVILGIISAAIQLLEKLSSLTEGLHDKYIEKDLAINKLSDSVRNYELSVIAAQQAEENWFATDGLMSLRNGWEIAKAAMEAYKNKLGETQAKYINKEGGGLFGNHTIWSSEWDDKVSARDNLRIETQAAKKGFLGIGSRNQETMNLEQWVKANFGQDLFDKNNRLNIEAVDELLNNYGDLLQGQTAETLEALKEYQEKYDEYIAAVREYASQMYEPLVDNFVDSMWVWFDEGKDALDSFKDYAAQTFRAILSDMVRTLAMKYIFDGFDEGIQELYEKYARYEISEQELMKGVTDLTDRLMKNAEDNIPMMQNIMNYVDDALQGVGIDMKGDDGSASSNTLSGDFAKASQESIDVLAGHTAGNRIATEKTAQMSELIHGTLIMMRDLQINGWKEVTAIRELSVQVASNTENIRALTANIAESSGNIANSTANTAATMRDISHNGVKIKMNGI